MGQVAVPERKGYLDVYDHYQLLGERSVFAHGVHLCDEECARLAETGSAVAFCPTSNLFLGSGLFNLPMAEKHKLNVGLGTDVGAGTSFSLLNTLNEAYKVMQLQGARLDPFKSLYLATLGGGREHCAWKTRSAICNRAATLTSWYWTTTLRH
ncbi:guanine deaminase GuaD [Pseudomonas fragi]|uniref:Guanine deaminase GuaD n=1 Tax=Pseudomonas fragi TaxID=296 RepID=A0A449IF20_PSEFR|nr:guanine deaminase GuaD [Pseudomonas fragi]